MTRIKDLPTFETLDSENWVAVDTNSEETESGKASVEVLSSYLSANLPFVQSVNQSTGISVNNSDPNNPLVGLSQSSQDALNLATTAVQPHILGGLAYQDQITVPDIDATGTPTSSSALFGDGVWRTMPGGGNMLSAIYDPQNISNDAFDLANHTGEVPPSSVNELGLTRRLSARVGGMFDTVSDLLADTTLTYSNVSSGDIIEAQGFRYEVAASAASDEHLTTAGGVKLYVLPDAQGHSVCAHGAINDASTDVAAIVSADAAAAAAGVPLVFDTDCTIDQQILISASEVVRTKGRITISKDFVTPSSAPVTNGDRRRFTAFVNANWNTSFDAETADTIKFKGLHFYLEKPDDVGPMQGFLGFGNVLDCEVASCKFEYEEGQIFPHPLAIKMAGGVKGLDIHHNSFKVECSNGGTFWAQGYSGSHEDPDGASERVHFHENNVVQIGGAEVYSAWGAGGIIQDFSFWGNKVKAVEVPTPLSIMASLNSSATVGVTRRGDVYDNDLDFQQVATHALVIGNTYLSDQISDIRVYANRLRHEGTEASASTGYGIRVREEVVNVDIFDNTLDVVGDHVVSRGIAGNSNLGSTRAWGNTVRGYNTGIQGVMEDRDNYVEAVQFASLNCFNIIGGDKFAAIPLRVGLSSDVLVQILNTRATCTAEEGSTQIIYVSGDCGVVIDGVIATSNNASARSVQLTNSGMRSVRNSKFLGTGLGPSGLLSEAGGNEFYGVSDFSAAAWTDWTFEMRQAYPLGYFLRDSNPSVSVDLIRLGWILRDDAGTRRLSEVEVAAP